MNIYAHELRANRKSLLVWAVSLGALTVFFLSFYPLFRNSADDILKLLQGFPETVREALGFPLDIIASPLGYYSFMVGYITLCGAVQAMSLGVSVLAKEAAGKTADFLLTKPVSRARILTAKLLAALTVSAATSLVFLAVASSAARAAAGAFDWIPFILLSLTFFYVQLIFVSLGFAVAAAAAKVKSVLSVSLSTVFAFFIVGMVGSALDQEALYYFSPFKYFDPLHIIEHSSYDWPFAAVGAAVVVVCVSFSYAVYARKDIHAV